MGVMDLDNDIDIDRARYDRENRLNPAEFPMGQDMDISSSGLFTGGMDDMSFDTTMSVDTSSMQSMFSGGNQWATPYGNGYNMGMNNQPQQNQSGLTYDKAVDMTKNTVSGITQIFESFKYVNVLFWYNYSFKLCIIGLVISGISLLTMIFGFSKAFTLLLTGLLCLFGGGSVWFILKHKSLNYTSEYKEENNNFSNNSIPQEPIEDNWLETSSVNESENYDPYNIEEEPLEPDIDVPELDWDLNTENDNIEEPLTAEEALNTLGNVQQGMYTRQYLYEAFTKVLPNMKPNFSALTDIDETDDSFIQMEESLREAAEVCGVKEDVTLLKLQENFSTIICECTRPVGFKPDSVAEELARIYAHRSKSDPSKVYAQAESVGRRCIITIFTGNSAMISLKDMMMQVEDYILDTNNYIPVVFGIDPKGKVIVYDFKKLESIIITGMPRSGKSWFVQAILTQMCAFVPPTELHIYICDPKDKISDFKAFCLPHVKKFVSKDDLIIETLRNVVKVEAPRRKKIIGDAGFVNIWDFKERHPDVYLPIIYVVVDEIVTLASRMDKETNNEFRMLLRELISQLPALGIRAFFIPHVLNNDIIEKKTSDLVPCKISVCGDADHIEKATGSKFKDFPYKLTNKGDMAVRMPAVSPSTMFIHGPALTESNPKNNDLFDYLRRVWSKLESSETNNSVAKLAEEEASIKDIATKELEVEDLDIFDVKSDNDYSEETINFRDTIIGG